MSRSFTYRIEGDIKRYMNGQPDKEEAAGTVYNASLPFLKVDECERVKGQLADDNCYHMVDFFWPFLG